MSLTFDVKNLGLEMTRCNNLTFDVMSDVKFSADIRKELGRWMQKTRESKGLTQQYVAKKIELTDTQLSRIENGKSGTERDTIILWARAVGVDENTALRKFKPENFDEDTHVIIDGIRVSFDDKKFTQTEKENFLNVMKMVAAGAKATAAKESPEMIKIPNLGALSQEEKTPKKNKAA